MVGSLPPGARLACGARGNARPLPGLALRSAAAADDRPGGDAILSGLHCQMAACRGSGRRPGRSGNERFCGSWLLFASAEPARLRQGNRSGGAADFRARKPNCARFQALAAIPPRRMRRSPSAPNSPRRRQYRRVLARLIALDEPIARARGEIASAAQALAPRDRAGDFAQALMDIGAVLCRPRNPDCGACPLALDCAAFRAGTPEAFPRRAEAKARPRRQGAVFFARRSDGAFLARRRPPHGLLASTIELPGTPWTSKVADSGLAGAAPVAAHWRRLPGEVEQVFTHFALRLTVYAAEFEGGARPTVFGSNLTRSARRVSQA